MLQPIIYLMLTISRWSWYFLLRRHSQQVVHGAELGSVRHHGVAAHSSTETMTAPRLKRRGAFHLAKKQTMLQRYGLSLDQRADQASQTCSMTTACLSPSSTSRSMKHATCSMRLWTAPSCSACQRRPLPPSRQAAALDAVACANQRARHARGRVGPGPSSGRLRGAAASLGGSTGMCGRMGVWANDDEAFHRGRFVR